MGEPAQRATRRVHVDGSGAPTGVVSTGPDQLMWIVINAHRRADLSSAGGWVAVVHGPLPGQPRDGRMSVLLTSDSHVASGWWLSLNDLADPADGPL